MKKNFASFYSPTCLSEQDDEVKNEVAHHLCSQHTEFKSYFPDFGQDNLSLVKNPFRAPIEQVDDEFQNDLIELNK